MRSGVAGVRERAVRSTRAAEAVAELGSLDVVRCDERQISIRRFPDSSPSVFRAGHVDVLHTASHAGSCASSSGSDHRSYPRGRIRV